MKLIELAGSPRVMGESFGEQLRSQRLSEFLCNLHSAGGKTFGEKQLKVG